ncbi:MAG: hemerythrin domain-containing protein [Rhizobiaceae bacterium]|nr:hemerythrin domain-containing protein [Rhizobiaceae bacterium]
MIEQTQPPDLKLVNRTGLPEPLRVLVEQYPRDIWESHSNFDGLVKFWLERHVMFRKLLKILQEDTAKLENNDLDPLQFKARLSRFGGMFVNELHAHHSIEDHQYFPLLIGMEKSLQRGFDILDKDHHELDAHINTFATLANATLQLPDEISSKKVGELHEQFDSFERFLNRHLTDEEELVVPIILKHGFDH